MTTQNWQDEPATETFPATGTADAGTSTSTAALAKDEAKEVAREGGQAAKEVAQTAATEAKHVAQEAGYQARNLISEFGTGLKEQAGSQQQKLAEGLRSVSDELRTMLDGSGTSGTASAVMEQVAQRSGAAADWLGSREPQALLADVKAFARRRPGLFLLIAAGAGLAAGRLTRGLAAGQSGTSAAGSASTAAAPRPVVTAPASGMVDDLGTVPGPFTDPYAGEPIIEPGTPPRTGSGPEGRLPL